MTITIPNLSAAETEALEAMFVQELPGAEPVRISKKLGNALVAKGFAEPAELVFRSGLAKVRVQTWKISWAGHMAYCEACRDVEIPE